MAYINGRGAYVAFDAVASSDLTRSVAVTSNGVATDLTGGSIEAVVRDSTGNTSSIIVGIYAQIITDVANGLWTFKIPKTSFGNHIGEELSYEIRLIISGVDTPLMHGEISIFEAL